MQKAYGLGVGLALLAGTGAFARDDDPKGKQKPGGQDRRDPATMFRRMDKNGDGKVSKDELEGLPELARERMSRADADGDGAVTQEEFLAVGRGRPGKGKNRPGGDASAPEGKRDKGPPKSGDESKKPGGEGTRAPGKLPDVAAVVKRLDTNGDGKLSKDEAKGPLANFFDRMDADSDGFLSESELRAARERAEKMGLGKKGDGAPRKREGGKKPEGDAPKGEKGPAKGAGGPDVSVMLQRLDSNGDGKISKEEARGPLAENFDRVDADKDGFISKEEVAAVGRRMQAAKGPMAGLRLGEPSLVNLFNQQDADADGRVTRAEAKGKLLDHFDALDADKDGKLSRQEAEAGMKKLAGAAPAKK